MKIKVFRNAEIYTPEYIGVKDVLVIAEKVVRIADSIREYDGLKEAEVIDCSGKILTPAYIDLHAHITGGGGEQSFSSRVPEAQLSAFTKNGVCTVVGLLGTDGITRSPENLLAKTNALREEGITVYCLTGSYAYPCSTLTGSVERDLCLITPMIGVKTAVSDHRGSAPGAKELIDLASQTRRGGMISGKPGLVTIHMGSGKDGLTPVLEAVRTSDIPAKHFLPTHILRTDGLIQQGAELVRMGGFVDCTAGCDEESVLSQTRRLETLLEMDGVGVDHVTLSSDAFGSQPRFDSEGECIGLTYNTSKGLHDTVKLLAERGWKLSEVLRLLTTTPAYLIGKKGIKGCVREGADADILLMNDKLEIESVYALGKTMIAGRRVIRKGRFEAD